MQRWFGILFLAWVASVGATAQTRPAGVVTSHDDGVSAEQPIDREALARVYQLLSIRPAERVADLRAGRGFFMIPFAGAVGAEGVYYAVESDPDLLEFLGTKAQGSPFGNVVVVRDTGVGVGLPEADLDLILAVDVWERLGDRAAVRDSVRKALKPGGRFVVIDRHEGKVPRKDLIAEMRASNWTLTTDARVVRDRYVLIFTPDAP